jgi:hypothetical protein
MISDSPRSASKPPPAAQRVGRVRAQHRELLADRRARADEERLPQQQLKDADYQQMELLRKFLAFLAGRPEGEARLLDRTMVLYGSNPGDANTHDNSNLPILLAGGGFRHGQHLAFMRDDNAPLGRLFVSMLQRLGIDADSFGFVQGPLSGLDLA